MPNTQDQIRRDTRANINAYVLAQGELGYGTDDGIVTIGDGATPGGSLLAPYAIGAWVPTLLGSTTAGAPTYTLQSGTYEKIGRQITCRFSVAISAIGGMVGNIFIGGLPFPTANVANDFGHGAVALFTGVTLDAGYSFVGLQLGLNVSVAQPLESGSNKSAASIPIANLAAVTRLDGVIHYHV